MPELPEVETIVRSVAPRLLGREIREARFYSRLVMRCDAARTAARCGAGASRRSAVTASSSSWNSVAA